MYGFLVGRGYSPAEYLQRLLLRAGDVESNPGPRCGVCGGTTSERGPKCEGCGKWVHLKCRSLKRGAFYGMEHAEGWRASCCETEVEEVRGVEDDKERMVDEVVGCVVCTRRLRTGYERKECRGCGLRARKRCCGLTRWRLERGESWWCQGCADEGGEGNQQEQVIDRVEIEGGRCQRCGGVRTKSIWKANREMDFASGLRRPAAARNCLA